MKRAEALAKLAELRVSNPVVAARFASVHRLHEPEPVDCAGMTPREVYAQLLKTNPVEAARYAVANRVHDTATTPPDAA